MECCGTNNKIIILLFTMVSVVSSQREERRKRSSQLNARMTEESVAQGLSVLRRALSLCCWCLLSVICCLLNDDMDVRVDVVFGSSPPPLLPSELHPLIHSMEDKQTFSGCFSLLQTLPLPLPDPFFHNPIRFASLHSRISCCGWFTKARNRCQIT